ncbi:hypothetical protein HispidOSU_010722 [Sigmodon hispidus]
MISDSGSVEKSEGPQEVISESYGDLGETPGDSPSGPYTHQTAPEEEPTPEKEPDPVEPVPVEERDPVEPAPVEEPDPVEPAPVEEPAQNFRAHPRKDIHFQTGEPSKTLAIKQRGVSADQTKSPAGSHLIAPNTQKTSLSDSQETAVPDSKETFCKEYYLVKTLSGRQTFVTYNIPLCIRQIIRSTENQDIVTGEQAASSEGEHSSSFSDEQTTNEDYQELPITCFYSHSVTRIRTKRMHVELYLPNPYNPSDRIPPSTCSSRKKVHKAKKAVSKSHKRQPSHAQSNNSGLLVPSQPQNVCTSQRSASSDSSGSSDPEVAPGGYPVPCHSLVPRQPPESISNFPAVQIQRVQKSTPKGG